MEAFQSSAQTLGMACYLIQADAQRVKMVLLTVQAVFHARKRGALPVGQVGKFVVQPGLGLAPIYQELFQPFNHLLDLRPQFLGTLQVGLHRLNIVENILLHGASQVVDQHRPHIGGYCFFPANPHRQDIFQSSQHVVNGLVIFGCHQHFPAKCRLAGNNLSNGIGLAGAGWAQGQQQVRHKQGALDHCSLSGIGFPF